MIEALLYRSSHSRFYRVEITLNLFAEASVVIEWGLIGGRPCQRVTCHSDLRAASTAADRYRQRAIKRGYARAA
ncbi:WGR domain-containing protein [uncultured Tateyamaria sp.]|uniref:WGR domain-containing protein n=1 Tax=uncultured Tateyamaria sp. TaxID=455651 RepID=UPI00261CD83C|nr:WGR domain-containing protein [uncultured Tateyamaria sp.]